MTTTPPDPLLRQRHLAEQARAAHLRWLPAGLGVDLVLDVGAIRCRASRRGTRTPV